MLHRTLTLLVASTVVLPLMACEIRVQRDGDDHATDVDIDTPRGDVSVRSDAIPSDVGLPVYRERDPSWTVPITTAPTSASTARLEMSALPR